MANVIQKAVEGQRKSMELLYEANKKKVFYIAQNLLLDEKQAEEVTIWTFKNVWSAINVSYITTEEDFTHLAVKKAVDYCRKKTAKQNPKAFRIPDNKNFLISTDKTVSENDNGFMNFILKQFPELQRFIFVLHTIGNYDKDELANTFKIDIKTVNIALEAERINIENIIGLSEKGNNCSYNDIVQSFKENEKNTKIPAETDKQIADAVERIAAPAEKKRKKNITVISIISVIVCLCIVGGIFIIISFSNKTYTTDVKNTSSVSNVDESVNSTDIGNSVDMLDADLVYYADIKIQDYGTITIRLDQKSAPVTAANFVNLAESGFYDGLTFHRIVEGFMMQGGDPNGDSTGGSENTIVGEFTANGYDNNLSHTRGAVSMARSTDYNSASSQFFIVHEDSTFLDGQYAVFGYVTEGMDVVDAICEAAEPTDSNGMIAADAQPVITSVTIKTE